MNRFLSEIQGKYTELVQIVKISISFKRLVFPMKFHQFSHPMTEIRTEHLIIEAAPGSGSTFS